MISTKVFTFISMRAMRLSVYFLAMVISGLGFTQIAFAQMSSGHFENQVPGHIPSIEQEHVVSDSLLDDLPVLQRKQAMELTYISDYYRSNQEILHHVSVKYQRDWNRFALELNGMWADRFGFQGQNYGIGLYPQITKSTYIKLNGTYSVDSFYPQWSAGGSLTQGFFGFLELEGGYQYISFQAEDIELYKGAIGLYPGNWEIRAWGFLPVEKEIEDYSGSGRIRYLGKNKDTFIGVQGGYGPIAEGINFIHDCNRKTQLYGALIWSLRLNPSWDLVGRAGYHQEEFKNSDATRERIHGELGFVIKF